jgi:hypothetical protein
MRRAPKKAYLVLWRTPRGRPRKKWYVRGPAVGLCIEKLARESCTDVRVLEGVLKDVSTDFLAEHYDREAVEIRRQWAKGSELRTRLLTDADRVERLMRPGRAQRVMRVLEPVANRFLRPPGPTHRSWLRDLPRGFALQRKSTFPSPLSSWCSAGGRGECA